MEEKTKHNDLIGYILSQLTEDVDRLKDEVYGCKDTKALALRISIIESDLEDIEQLKKIFEQLKERVNVLEKEDKKSRLKIVTLILVLIFTSLAASLPKLLNMFQIIEKYL
jgi:DNA mismatch repair ATPase MutS